MCRVNLRPSRNTLVDALITLPFHMLFLFQFYAYCNFPLVCHLCKLRSYGAGVFFRDLYLWRELKEKEGVKNCRTFDCNWGVRLAKNDFGSVLQKNCSFRFGCTKLTAVSVFGCSFFGLCCLMCVTLEMTYFRDELVQLIEVTQN